MRNLAIRPLGDLLPGSQVVAAMSESDAARLGLDGANAERFYLSWDMRQDLTRYCLTPEQVAHETAWTVLEADRDGKWVLVHLALVLPGPGTTARVVTHTLSQRAATRVEVIEPPRAPC